MLTLLQNFAVACQPKGNFLGLLPTWYKYLDGQIVRDGNGVDQCVVKITDINNVWLVVAAVVDMLLRIAVLIAIAFVVVGGVKYITSQGAPDKTEQAKNTIISALVGLVISIGAATLVTFIAGKF